MSFTMLVFGLVAGLQIVHVISAVRRLTKRCGVSDLKRSSENEADKTNPLRFISEECYGPFA